jgi:hypothetical protein
MVRVTVDLTHHAQRQCVNFFTKGHCGPRPGDPSAAMSNIVKRTKTNTPEQLSFEIFESLRGPGLDITKSPREIGYRKGKVLRTVTALSLVQRRVVNACWFLAAQNPNQESYDVDLSYFKWLARYDKSENHAHLRKVINECQKATVQVTADDEETWVSVQLIGRVATAGGRVSFKVDELIRRELANPKGFSFLSLRIGAALSQYGYALYEYMDVLRYQGTTDWYSVDEVRAWVNADAYPSLAEFKQFKRYVLEKSRLQINELTDLKVEFEVRTAPGSRKVSHIRFIIRDNPNGALVLDATRPHELNDLYDTLVNDFGLSQEEIQELVDNRGHYTDDRILAAIEFTRVRAQSGKVKQPARYLMKAIRDQLKLGTIEKENAQVKALPSPDAEPSPTAKANQEALNEAVGAQSEAGVDAYLDLDAEGQEALREDLAREITFKSALKRAKVTSFDEETLLAVPALRFELGSYAYRRLVSPPAAAKGAGARGGAKQG